jgi:hypothetical protein
MLKAIVSAVCAHWVKQTIILETLGEKDDCISKQA